MTISDQHLTEEQRHRAAEGGVAPDEEAAMKRHLRICDSCAIDVARLARLVAHARAAATAPAAAPAQDLWPSIHDRIEQAKVVPLPTPGGEPATRRRRGVRRPILAVGGAAAAVALFLLGRLSNRPDGSAAAPSAPVIVAIADSAGAYEEQARILFDRLELERSRLRPEALAAIDRDLRVVNAAIVELDAAAVREPHNTVVRSLLASSYREKVDILKRLTNAE